MFLLCLSLAFLSPQSVALPAPQPAELGMVRWQRDLPAALQQSKASGKPVFLLFQEIPGCATCIDFGGGPLSHPLIVDAIESEFVPVAVYNNKEGVDAQILAEFEEPSWNNPVVRFIDSEKKDLIPRKDRIWESHDLVKRMIAGLQAANRPVPTYLYLALQETIKKPESATFSMHCYWEGEISLGGLDGVLATRAGWRGDKEVVEVQFDPQRIQYADLLLHAMKMECAQFVYPNSSVQKEEALQHLGKEQVLEPSSTRDVKRSERKYYLHETWYRHLPLTPVQMVRVNAALGKKEDPSAWLSPRQLELSTRLAKLAQQSPEKLKGFLAPEELEGYWNYQNKLMELLKENKTAL